MEIHHSQSSIAALERLERIALINSCVGYRPACLIGTQDAKGRTNLSIFSSVIHLGSDPALIGLVSRPGSVPRHTLANIQASGVYTINHVHSGITEQAHFTSAKFDADTSEFEACGLQPVYKDEHAAPFVQESRIQLGMELVEIMDIEANGTVLIIGRIAHLYYPSDIADANGQIDHDKAHTSSVTGLDRYHRGVELARYPYARVENVPEHLKENKERPDQVVFDEKEQKYNASLLPFATDQGAPSIVPTDLTLWKKTGASKISHHLKTRYEEIRSQFEEMKELYSWNEIVYQAKFSFEPVLGQVYHLYRDRQEQLFLSMIAPETWDREHLGSFRLNADQIWEKVVLS